MIKNMIKIYKRTLIDAKIVPTLTFLSVLILYNTLNKNHKVLKNEN